MSFLKRKTTPALLTYINLFGGDWPEFLKLLLKNVDSSLTENREFGDESFMKQARRTPAQNTSFSVHFVIKGAEKRRSMAYAKAKTLQRELGVIPHLVSVK